MINCDDFSKQLSDFFDGELPKERSRMLNTHVSACSVCAKKLAHTHALSKFMKRLKKVTTTEQFEEQLHNRLQSELNYQDQSGTDRTVFTLSSIPLRHVVAIFAAAAAIVFAVITFDSYLSSEDATQAVVSPRIEIPPLPGSTQQNIMRQSPYAGLPIDSRITTMSDSANEKLSSPDLERSLPYIVLQSIRNQILQVKDHQR